MSVDNSLIVKKTDLSEDDIRVKYIDPAIRNAGWDEEIQIRRNVYFTDGRIYVKGNKTQRGKRKLNVRVAIPSRSTKHNQAAIHTVWTPGTPMKPRQKLNRLYGFRKFGADWTCVTYHDRIAT